MKRWLITAGVAGLMLAALPTFAQSPSPVSDWLKVWDGAGSLVASVVVTEADEVANGPSFIYTVPIVAIDPTQFGNPTVLTEPGSTQLSDIFGIASVNGGLFLAFASDVDGVPFPYGAGKLVLPETGVPVDATMYLDPGLQANNWTAAFWSDADTAPDGGVTAGLLGLGMLGLGLLRRVTK